MQKRCLILLSAVLFSGCFTMRQVAPPMDDRVTLMSETEDAKFKKTKRIWYALWGLTPITENNSANVIRDYRLNEVRITTKRTFVDFLIGAFTGLVSIVPATMVIEGNGSGAQAMDAVNVEQQVEQAAAPNAEPSDKKSEIRQ